MMRVAILVAVGVVSYLAVSTDAQPQFSLIGENAPPCSATAQLGNVTNLKAQASRGRAPSRAPKPHGVTLDPHQDPPLAHARRR